MKKEMQNFVYLELGKRLTEERNRRNLSIPHLVRLSGEQNVTLRKMEKGKPCSFHHIVWMRRVLGISLDQFVDSLNMEEVGDKKESGDSDYGDLI